MSTGGTNVKLYQYAQRKTDSMLYQSYHFNTILSQTGDVKINYISLAPYDYAPKTEAAIPKLLLIISGEGWIANSEGRIYVNFGEAVFWKAGEYVEFGSADGMTCISIEGFEISPDTWLQVLHKGTTSS